MPTHGYALHLKTLRGEMCISVEHALLSPSATLLLSSGDGQKTVVKCAVSSCGQATVATDPQLLWQQIPIVLHWSGSQAACLLEETACECLLIELSTWYLPPTKGV